MQEISVIMCTWKRPERIGRTLKMLESQSNRNFSFHIWNNNPAIAPTVALAIKDKPWAFLHNNPTNIGGMGRFHMAKAIGAKKVLFVDDDQDFGKSLVEDALRMYKEQTIRSWWAWKIKSGYRDRKRIWEGDADYCGTGGMLVDGAIFGDDAVFQIPPEYSFIEDLWLSMVAKERQWHLTGLPVDIKTIVDNKDQYRSLMPLKEKMYKDYCEKKFRF